MDWIQKTQARAQKWDLVNMGSVEGGEFPE